VPVEGGEIVDSASEIRVIRPQGFLRNVQSLSIERLCLRIFALVTIEIGKAKNGGGDIAMIRP